MSKDVCKHELIQDGETFVEYEIQNKNILVFGDSALRNVRVLEHAFCIVCGKKLW